MLTRTATMEKHVCIREGRSIRGNMIGNTWKLYEWIIFSQKFNCHVFRIKKLTQFAECNSKHCALTLEGVV